MTNPTRSLHPSAPNYSDPADAGPSIQALLSSFRLTLRAEGLTEKTFNIYADAIHRLEAFRLDRGMPSIPSMSTEHVREFLGDMQGRNAPSTVNQRYRSLKRFYRWLLEEGEIRESPMVRIKPPKVPDQIKEHYGTEGLERVLKACGEKSWTSLRDRAMVLVLYDTGVRASELCGMRMDDLDMDEQAIKVTGKGGKERVVPMGNKAALMLDKYLRKRPATLADHVWISTRGQPMTFNALRMCLRRRFQDAGVPFKGIHGFRRSFAIAFLDAGGYAEDLQQIAGWNSLQMVQRYTKATASARARRAHKKLSPADRLVGR
ncbi:MAG: tyrosine-type recombinase/integrase [Dehalococcoidia bacterium]